MAQKPYQTQLKHGAQWSVAVHEHHKAGAQSGYPTLQAAAYAADQGKVGDVAKGALEGYTTMGGSKPDRTPERMAIGRSSTPVTVVSHRATGRPDDDYSHASVRVWTPEGHELSPAHVQGIMAGTHDAHELREHYQDQHEVKKQLEYEHKIVRHLYLNNNTLPHSGVDALAAGVPSSGSSEGAHILNQISEGRTPSSVDYPHYLEGAGSENPSTGVSNKDAAAYQAKIDAGVPRDRAGDRGRIVDHR